MVEGNIALQTFCPHRPMGPFGLMIILLVGYQSYQSYITVLSQGTTQLCYGRKLFHSTWFIEEGGKVVKEY